MIHKYLPMEMRSCLYRITNESWRCTTSCSRLLYITHNNKRTYTSLVYNRSRFMQDVRTQNKYNVLHIQNLVTNLPNFEEFEIDSEKLSKAVNYLTDGRTVKKTKLKWKKRRKQKGAETSKTLTHDFAQENNLTDVRTIDETATSRKTPLPVSLYGVDNENQGELEQVSVQGRQLHKIEENKIHLKGIDDIEIQNNKRVSILLEKVSEKEQSISISELIEKVEQEKQTKFVTTFLHNFLQENNLTDVRTIDEIATSRKIPELVNLPGLNKENQEELEQESVQGGQLHTIEENKVHQNGISDIKIQDNSFLSKLLEKFSEKESISISELMEKIELLNNFVQENNLTDVKTIDETATSRKIPEPVNLPCLYKENQEELEQESVQGRQLHTIEENKVHQNGISDIKIKNNPFLSKLLENVSEKESISISELMEKIELATSRKILEPVNLAGLYKENQEELEQEFVQGGHKKQRHAKTMLNNIAQQNQLPLPTYHTVYTDYNDCFISTVTFNGSQFKGRTSHNKRRDAEHSAAQVALIAITVELLQTDEPLAIVEATTATTNSTQEPTADITQTVSEARQTSQTLALKNHLKEYWQRLYKTIMGLLKKEKHKQEH